MLPLIFKMSLPAVAAQLVNLLYNIVDRIYIGHIPGINRCFSWNRSNKCCHNTDIFLLCYCRSGRKSTCSHCPGTRKPGACRTDFRQRIHPAAHIYHTDFRYHLLVYEPILLFTGASENTIGYATDYLSIYLLGTLFVELSVGLNTFINTQGRPTIAMYSVLIGAILNIGLDPLFIFTFGMGVKGAALATILSQACSAIWVISFLTSKKASLRLEYRYMKLHKGIILSILALGVSPFIMASTESLVGFVLNSSLEKFGDIYVSALAIMQSAMLIVSVPLTGFAQGFVPIVSYNYGHHNRERVKECFKIVVIIMFSFNFLLISFMILFPSLVASAFTNDETLIETVRQVMPIFLGGMTIFGLQRACQNMFVALGQAKVSVFIALLRKVILLIPLALILPRFMGMPGVYAAEGISDATAAICCTLIFAIQFPRILRKMV